MNSCPSCRASLGEGALTLPWEDGDNPYAYVTCPHCGYQLILDGFGEDED